MNLVKNRRAFTLIELMIVVAIIAILATIVIINVTGARTKANNTNVLSTMINVQKVAAQCLYADYYLNGNIITGALSTSGDICTNTSVVGGWPTSAISLKSSVGGRNWSLGSTNIGPTNTATAGVELFITANTFETNAVNGDLRINCSLTGCAKELCNGTSNTACFSTTTW